MKTTDKTTTGRQPGGKRFRWSTLFKVVIPLVITIGLCWQLFTVVNFSEMMAIIRENCDFRWILLALTLSVVSHVVRAMRWQIQLRAIDVKPPLFALVLSIFGTYAVNLVFPRLGELWRTGYISEREKAPFDGVFGSMVADRLADTATVALITLVTLLIAGGPLIMFVTGAGNNQILDKAIGIATSVWTYVGIVVIAAAIWFGYRRLRQTALIGKIRGFVAGLWKGFSVVATMPGRGRWLLLTVALWGCYFLQLYAAFFAFPATAEVAERYGVGAVMICFVLSSISMIVPSNGGLGPWQQAIVFGLSIYAAGIPALTEAYAISFANLVMGSQTLLLILLGIFTFICIGIERHKLQNIHDSI